MDDNVYRQELARILAFTQYQLALLTNQELVLKRALEDHLELIELKEAESARLEDERYTLLQTGAGDLTDSERRELIMDDERIRHERESKNNSHDSPRGRWQY